MLTLLLGTMIGVPGFTSPPSITTPTTMGSLALNTQSGRMRSLQGNTAMFLYSSLFLSFSSYTLNNHSQHTHVLTDRQAHRVETSMLVCMVVTSLYVPVCVAWSCQTNGKLCRQWRYGHQHCPPSPVPPSPPAHQMPKSLPTCEALTNTRKRQSIKYSLVISF